MMTSEELLTKGLMGLGLSPTPHQVNSFMSYLLMIKKWQKAYSLTALKTDEEIIVKHFLDSSLYLNVLPEGVDSLADIGSGAGFPGIPIKIILPELNVYLIEPSRKKSAFLRHTVRTLRLDKITIVEKQVEELRGYEFDVVVTRALFSVKEFIKKAGHITKKGGVLIISKGLRFKEELKGLKAHYEILTLRLPIAEIERYMVVIRD